MADALRSHAPFAGWIEAIYFDISIPMRWRGCDRSYGFADRTWGLLRFRFRGGLAALSEGSVHFRFNDDDEFLEVEGEENNLVASGRKQGAQELAFLCAGICHTTGVTALEK